MTIEFHCPSCNKLLRTADNRAGARAKCPDCGTGITVPGGAGGDFDLGEFDDYGDAGGDQFDSAFGGGPARPPAAAATKNCPMCGAEIRAAAVKCRFCGEMLGEPPAGRGRGRRSGYEEARRRVQGPAIAMMITFGLTLVALMIFLPIAMAGPVARQNNRMPFPMGGPPGLILVMGAVQAIICIVIIAGAWQMRGLKSYGLAMTGSILAMIPYISPCCLLGLPFGIWSIVVLNDDNVKNAFR